MSPTPGHTQASAHPTSSPNHLYAESPRRPLPFTIRGDHGFREGELWMVDERRLSFWSSERQTENSTYDARVDLLVQGGNLDLRLRVSQVRLARSATAGKGYVHMARYRTRSSAQVRQLCEVFRRFNPERTPDPAATDSLSDHEAESMSAIHSVSPPSREPRLPRTASTQPRSTPPSAGSAARHTGPVGPPEPVVPVLGPGTPVSVLLKFEDARALRRSLLLERGDLFLYTAPVPILQRMEGATLHLQLPQGLFLTLQGTVSESTQLRCAFVVRRIDASVMTTLTTALSEPSIQ